MINVHEHLQSRQELPRLLGSMDEMGITRVVLLGSSAFTITSDYRLGFTRYHENNREIIGAARAHTDRIEAWPTLNPVDHNLIDQLRSYHAQGASGLKLYSGHGYVAPHSSSYLFSSIAMDDPRMDPVYDYCATYRLPICLQVNPCALTPGFADEFVTVLQRHPRLLVNAPHWIMSSTRPARLMELLDVFPNLLTDISLGIDEFLIEGLRRISRNASTIREIVERHPDRFMFGTDFVVTCARHKTPGWMRLRIEAYLSMLSCEEYETPIVPSELLNGLALPIKVLEKVRSENYLRFRAPDRDLSPPTRPMVWSRMEVPLLRRRPGERLW